jgi:transcriptional regulator with XRE-family HTH domain
MRKDAERKLGRNYFVKDGLTAKQIAEKVNVSEATVGRWREEDSWEDLRVAELTSDDSLIDSLRDEIMICIDDRISGKITVIQSADGISKIRKTIETLQKNKITLEQYISVMKSVFQAMQKHEPKYYGKLIDFQDSHLIQIAKELG